MMESILKASKCILKRLQQYFLVNSLEFLEQIFNRATPSGCPLVHSFIFNTQGRTFNKDRAFSC